MLEILKPFTFEDLPTKPEITGRPRVSEDIQQTLAMLVGWDSSTRRLIKCSPAGILFVSQPTVKGVVNITAGIGSYNWPRIDMPTSEVLVLANPDNSGRVWVNKGNAAAADTGFPLDAGDSIVWGVNNLLSLHIHIVTTGEKAIVVYTI